MGSRQNRDCPDSYSQNSDSNLLSVKITTHVNRKHGPIRVEVRIVNRVGVESELGLELGSIPIATSPNPVPTVIPMTNILCEAQSGFIPDFEIIFP